MVNFYNGFNTNGYTCRAVTGCDVVAETSPEIRFHWMRDHAEADNPLDQAQYINTRRGLSRWMDAWYKSQPEDRQYVCEFDNCDRSNSLMSAAGLTSHYVFKHTDSARAQDAMQYAEANGLLELMRSNNRATAGTVTVPAPF